jgi:hypothetical protein
VPAGHDLNAEKLSVSSYIGNGVSGDWFSENVMPASRVSDA